MLAAALQERDIIAVEFVTPESGNWRWSLASVAPAPTGSGASARSIFVLPWEPVPRRHLTADERAKATELEEQATTLLTQCLSERHSLDAARVELLRRQRDVQQELAAVELQLAAVLPILDVARAKVAGIKVAHLREIRAYSKPPDMIRSVIEPVQILLGEPAKSIGAWDKARALMASVDFVSRVRDLDPLAVPAAVAERFIAHVRTAFPGIELETIDLGASRDNAGDVERAYRASAAAGPLLEWVLAMRRFLHEVPPEAVAMFRNVQQLRVQATALQQKTDESAKQLRATEKRNAELLTRIAEIRLGLAAARLIDKDPSTQHAGRFVLLKDVDARTAGTMDPWTWQPAADELPRAVLRSSILGRLRKALSDGDDTAPQAVGTEELDGSSTDDRFDIHGGMVVAVQKLAGRPIEVHDIDVTAITRDLPPTTSSSARRGSGSGAVPLVAMPPSGRAPSKSPAARHGSASRSDPPTMVDSSRKRGAIADSARNRSPQATTASGPSRSPQQPALAPIGERRGSHGAIPSTPGGDAAAALESHAKSANAPSNPNLSAALPPVRGASRSPESRARNPRPPATYLQ
jgi:hypothetical protein